MSFWKIGKANTWSCNFLEYQFEKANKFGRTKTDCNSVTSGDIYIKAKNVLYNKQGVWKIFTVIF